MATGVPKTSAKIQRESDAMMGRIKGMAKVVEGVGMAVPPTKLMPIKRGSKPTLMG